MRFRRIRNWRRKKRRKGEDIRKGIGSGNWDEGKRYYGRKGNWKKSSLGEVIWDFREEERKIKGRENWRWESKDWNWRGNIDRMGKINRRKRNINRNEGIRRLGWDKWYIKEFRN